MELIDGIKMKGKGVEIPDVGRRQLPGFFKQMGYKVGVEIGVQRGHFTKRLCRVGLKVYAVDPWKSYHDYKAWKGYQRHQDRIYEIAEKTLSVFPTCTLVRKKSMEAVRDFKRDSIDFVYIDGHHGFKYVAEDIYEWSKIVRKGGIISGHDYGYGKQGPQAGPYVLQVRYVVDAYTEALGIKNWWILGRKVHKTGERRDQWRSWMWIRE